MQRGRVSDSKRTAVIVLAILALTVVVRLPSLFMPLWNLDEAVYAVVGESINDGGVPYRDAADHKPPLPHFAFALIFHLFGQYNMTAAHTVLMGMIAAMILCTYALARLAFDRRTGLFAALLFAVLSTGAYPGNVNEMYALNTEWFLILFTLAASLLFVRGILVRQNPALTALAGVAYGLAFFSKQPALFDGLAAFGVLVYLAARPAKGLAVGGWRSAIAYCLWIGAGFVAIGVVFVGYFAARGVWEDFAFGFFTYNSDYYVAAYPLWKRLAKIPIHFLLASRPLLIGGFALGGAVLVARRALRAPADPKTPAALFVVLWAGLAFFASTLSGRSFGHYYIQALPAACVLAGWAMRNVFAQAWSWRRSAAVALAIFFAAGSLLVVGKPVHKSLWEARQTVSPSYDAANFIRAHSGPEDRIFVWGFWPQLYVWADRKGGTRYAFCNFQTGLIPWANIRPEQDTSATVVPGSMDRLIGDLEQNRPLFFVDTSPGDYSNYGKYPIAKFERLAALVQKQYRQEKKIFDKSGRHHFTIYRIQPK